MLATEWKSRSIYQIVTDRFAPTTAEDEARAGACDPGYLQGQFCGGTWLGIIRKLDYIQGMGFDAIWISPITKTIEDKTDYGYAYHGYWPENLYALNPHFGTPADLLALSDALHARGMALMVDVVVQHMGSPAQVDLTRYTPFNEPGHYHEKTFITDYKNQTLIEQGWLGNGQVPLPDLNTENPVVVSTLNSWIAALVQRYRVDGLRLDTVKHVRPDFWPGFIEAAGCFGLGEVLHGNPDYLARYQPYTGGLIDYATYYPLLRAFGPLGDMAHLGNLLAPSYRAKFRDTQLLATFMENHDNPRFPNTSQDPAVVRNAMAFTVLSDGIPIIYYGQEQGFSGGTDPACREPMWPSGWQQTPLYKHLALLNKARKQAWPVGFGQNLSLGLFLDKSTLVTQKGPLLMVLSNGGSGAANKTVHFPTKFANGTLLVDVLSGKCITVGKSSASTVIVAGHPQVFLPVGLAQQVQAGMPGALPSILPSSSGFRTKLSSLFGSSKSAAGLAASKLSSTQYSSSIPARATSHLGLSSRVAVPSITAPALAPSTASMRDPQSLFASPSASSSLKPSSAQQQQRRPNAITTSPNAQGRASTSGDNSPRTPSMTSTSASASASASASTSTGPATAQFYKQSNGSNGVVAHVNMRASRATTTPVNGRSAPQQQQQQSQQSQAQQAPSGVISGVTTSPGQTTSAAMQQARRQYARHITAPPASLSQHYRTASPLPHTGKTSHGQGQGSGSGGSAGLAMATGAGAAMATAMGNAQAQGLSSKYAYGSSGNHNSNGHGHGHSLSNGTPPQVQSRLLPGMRSNSESNLKYLGTHHGKQPGHAPSMQPHGYPQQAHGALRRQSSSQSLGQDGRANSMRSFREGTGVPPMPALPAREARKVLLDGAGPYAQGFSLSTTSLHAGLGGGGGGGGHGNSMHGYPRSRRSSNASLRSFHTVGARTSSDAARGRQALLAAETGLAPMASAYHYGPYETQQQHQQGGGGGGSIAGAQETGVPRIPMQGHGYALGGYPRTRSTSNLQQELRQVSAGPAYTDTARPARQ